MTQGNWNGEGCIGIVGVKVFFIGVTEAHLLVCRGAQCDSTSIAFLFQRTPRSFSAFFSLRFWEIFLIRTWISSLSDSALVLLKGSWYYWNDSKSFPLVDGKRDEDDKEEREDKGEPNFCKGKYPAAPFLHVLRKHIRNLKSSQTIIVSYSNW